MMPSIKSLVLGTAQIGHGIMCDTHETIVFTFNEGKILECFKTLGREWFY